MLERPHPLSWHSGAPPHIKSLTPPPKCVLNSTQNPLSVTTHCLVFGRGGGLAPTLAGIDGAGIMGGRPLVRAAAQKRIKVIGWLATTDIATFPAKVQPPSYHDSIIFDSIVACTLPTAQLENLEPGLLTCPNYSRPKWTVADDNAFSMALVKLATLIPYHYYA